MSGRLNINHSRADGFSAAEERAGNTESDGYEVQSLSGEVEGRLGEGARVELQSKYIYKFLDLDEGGLVVQDDPNSTSISESLINRLVLWSSMGSSGESELSGSYNQWRRTYENPQDYLNPTAFNYNYKGYLLQAHWVGTYQWSNESSFKVGSQWEQEKMSAPEDEIASVAAENRGLYLEQNTQWDGGLFWSFSGRWDDHSFSGESWTYRLAPGWHFPAFGWKVGTSVATGYNPPTLFQLNYFLGDQNLKAEKSQTVDVFVEKSIERGQTRLTYYRQNYFNLIDFDLKYVNRSEVVSRGLEWDLQLDVSYSLTTSLAYTYSEVQELGKNGQLDLRPYNFWSNTWSWSWSYWSASHLSWLHKGSRKYREETLPAHSVFRVGQDFKTRGYGRWKLIVDNLFDHPYQEIPGYGTAGLSAFVSVDFAL